MSPSDTDTGSGSVPKADHDEALEVIDGLAAETVKDHD